MKLPFWPNFIGAKPINFGLERVNEALKRLGNPQNNLPPTIHIAGTNGKGSTLAFLRAILEAENKKCHVYTSPHLVNFNERIVLAGEETSDDFLTKILQECKNKCEEINLTFFEGTTVAALFAFSKIKADYLLLETGMGGRLDATNIMGFEGNKPPAQTIITPISFDHMEFLGDSISKIAYEKACIIKQNIPCVISFQPEEALKVITDYAETKNSQTIKLEKDFNYKINQEGSFSYIQNEIIINLPKPSLLGIHQYKNAATAVASALQLGINKGAIINGIKTAKWPARLQKLAENIYLDGGHNAEAGEIISSFVKAENALNKKNNIAIIAMLKTKDYKTFIKNISSAFDEIYITIIPDDNYRSPDEIKDCCNEIRVANRFFENPISAIKHAKEKENSRVVICGSLHLAGYVLEKYR